MTQSIPENSLILVADGRKGIFFRSHGKIDDLSLSEERRLSPKDLLDDGPSGSRPEEQSPKQTDEATFAKQLANTLFKMKESGAYADLALVLDPQTLGQLRDAMHKTVADSVVTTLTKDLTNHSTNDIAAALKAHVQK